MRDPFETSKQCAFRVEGFPFYADVDGRSTELEYSERFGNVPAGHNSEWAKLIEEARARGGRVERLRIVSDPPSRYEHFEIIAGYSAGIAVGEDIRIAKKEELGIPFDFWVYDDKTIEIVNYDTDGNFAGSTVRAINESDRSIMQEVQRVFAHAVKIADFVIDRRDV